MNKRGVANSYTSLIFILKKHYMIFKINIEGNEIYFVKKNNIYSKSNDSSKIDNKLIYSETGKYSQNYEVLNKIYNEFYYVYQSVENLDIHFTLGNINYDILVFHGDIEISNSRNEKHIIKSVYTKFILYYFCNIDKFKITDFKMFRGGYSSFELEQDYLFSHCNINYSVRENNKIKINDGILSFVDICLGESELKKLLNTQYTIIDDIDMVNIFLYVDNFIRWESLEGGPYKKIYSIYNFAFGINNHIDIEGLEVIIPIIIRQKGLQTLIDEYKKIKIEENSLNEVIKFLNLFKPNCSVYNFIYDECSLEYHIRIEDSFALSKVYFNGNYIKVECKKFDLNIYGKYISTIFNNINTTIIQTIKKKLDNLLSVYEFEQEYEIVN